MPRLVPAAIGTGFLPLAELSAACRDGDLVKLDDAYICVDEPDRSELRADALRTVLPDIPASRHLVAIGWSAAWIYGAVLDAPWQQEVCVRADERATIRLPPRFRLRELRLRDDDEVVIAGLRVTTPRRTLQDLEQRATRSSEFNAARRHLRRLATRELATVDAVHVIDRIDATDSVEDTLQVSGVPHLENESRDSEPVV